MPEPHHAPLQARIAARCGLLLAVATALAPLTLAVPGQEKQGKVRQAERVEFQAADEVTVYADVYDKRAFPGAAVLVLFHDASGSRGEIRPTVKRFQDLGHPCLSVDLRVGAKVSKVPNYTALAYREKSQGNDVLLAELDVIAALRYARERFAGRRVVAIGCSFSAAHALRLAGTQPELVDGVVAFSPAEYFGSHVDSKTFVQDALGTVECPVLFLSARSEIEEWQPLFDVVPTAHKRSFVPAGRGRHGLRALWQDTAESEDYWGAVEAFLSEHFGALQGAGRASESDVDED